MKNIALFASGTGTNVENIANYFKDHPKIHIAHLLVNNPKAFVIERAKRLNIPTTLINRQQFYDSTEIIDLLKQLDIDMIVLAGFLWLIPENLVEAYPNKMINVHPALLPKYGGKGMYGDHVHKAVVENNEYESGITIHYVTKHYDEGAIIFQATCPVFASDSAKIVAQKVHKLEYEHYPKIIEDLLKD